MTNESRKLDVSNKLVEMGKSLLEEGVSTEDYGLTQSGSILIILATALLSDEDMLFFSELCTMFSAKKILSEMDGFGENTIISELLKKKRNEAKKTRKPRKNNDDENK